MSCARPDLWEPRAGNSPGPPDRFLNRNHFDRYNRYTEPDDRNYVDIHNYHVHNSHCGVLVCVLR